MNDIIEVSDVGEYVSGYATIFFNGEPISHHKTFEDAMKIAYPEYTMWNPNASCESMTDNFGD